MKHFLYLLVVSLQFSLTGTSRAQITIDLLVPAYANPCCDGGPNMWSSLISTAGDPSRNYDVHVILNPATGPGTALDPNYLNNAGVGPLADFRNAGGITHGYVATTWGNRPINEVKADIDAYVTGHYAEFVDGIFFDEMSNDLADVGYYQELHTYVQSQQAGARTIGNPGTTFTNNPSGQIVFDANDYINSLDTIMTFESTADEYANNYTSFPYLENLDRLKISHVIHTLGTWDATLLDTASDRRAGFLYVTDDIFLNMDTDNPYDSLASYWSDVTSDLQAHNATLVLLGDVNLDEVVNFSDISPFIAVLSSGGFQVQADCDENGKVDFSDISFFIAILSGS